MVSVCFQVLENAADKWSLVTSPYLDYPSTSSLYLGTYCMTVLMLRRSWLHSHQKIGRDRPDGRPPITWMKTVLNDLESHNLTLTEAVNMVQNHPLWRLLVVSGAMHALIVVQVKNDDNKPTFHMIMIQYCNTIILILLIIIIIHHVSETGTFLFLLELSQISTYFNKFW